MGKHEFVKGDKVHISPKSLYAASGYKKGKRRLGTIVDIVENDSTTNYYIEWEDSSVFVLKAEDLEKAVKKFLSGDLVIRKTSGAVFEVVGYDVDRIKLKAFGSYAYWYDKEKYLELASEEEILKEVKRIYPEGTVIQWTKASPHQTISKNIVVNIYSGDIYSVSECEKTPSLKKDIYIRLNNSWAPKVTGEEKKETCRLKEGDIVTTKKGSIYERQGVLETLNSGVIERKFGRIIDINPEYRYSHTVKWEDSQGRLYRGKDLELSSIPVQKPWMLTTWKIGDKVTLSEDSIYKKQGEKDGKNMTGTIKNIYSDSSHPYRIQWPDGSYNNYKGEDLSCMDPKEHRRLSVGSKVVINPTSPFHLQGEYLTGPKRGKLKIGTVLRINPLSDYVYTIRWCDGVQNVYGKGELIPIEKLSLGYVSQTISLPSCVLKGGETEASNLTKKEGKKEESREKVITGLEFQTPVIVNKSGRKRKIITIN